MEVAQLFCDFNQIVGSKRERLFKAVTDALKCVKPKNNLLTTPMVAIPEHVSKQRSA